MKTNEFLTEQQLDELGFLKNLGSKIAGGVAGWKAASDQAKGRGELNRMVNHHYAKIMQQAGGYGAAKGTADPDDVKQYLTSYGLDLSGIPDLKTDDARSIKDYVSRVVQQNFSAIQAAKQGRPGPAVSSQPTQQAAPGPTFNQSGYASVKMNVPGAKPSAAKPTNVGGTAQQANPQTFAQKRAAGAAGAQASMKSSQQSPAPSAAAGSFSNQMGSTGLSGAAGVPNPAAYRVPAMSLSKAATPPSRISHPAQSSVSQDAKRLRAPNPAGTHKDAAKSVIQPPQYPRDAVPLATATNPKQPKEPYVKPFDRPANPAADEKFASSLSRLRQNAGLRQPAPTKSTASKTAPAMKPKAREVPTAAPIVPAMRARKK